ncbi:MAG: DUF4139 domain-containing protein [bacterium]
MRKYILSLAVLLIFLAVPGQARVDISAPTRLKRTELTIYGKNDLTLVREFREITFREGKNRLSFNWQQKQVDPTSVFFTIHNNGDRLIKKDISYPSSTTGTLTWEVEGKEPVSATVEISYLTRGLDWNPFYHGRLNWNLTGIDLEGFVRIKNNSGIRFKNAKVNLLIGNIDMMDKLAKVIKNWERKRKPESEAETRRNSARDKMMATGFSADAPREMAREIEQARSSEYHLLELGKLEEISPDHDRRLQFTRFENVEVENIYRTQLDAQKNSTRHQLEFKNPSGDHPLPAGKIQLLRESTPGNLSWTGTARLNYLPPGGKDQLEIGSSKQVRAISKKMNVRSFDYSYDEKGRLEKWLEEEKFETKINNYRNIPVTLRLERQFPHKNWEIIEASHNYRQIDADRIRYELKLEPGEEDKLKETIQLENN